MCRLFGITSLKKENASYWMFDADTPFKDFSEREINRGPHNSGWGIGWLEGKSWKLFKEGKNDVKCFDFDKVRKVNSKKILIHLRHASQGVESTKNAHPFIYKNFIFAQNGKVNRELILKNLDEKFKKEIKTETDSEVYFLLLMQFFEKDRNFPLALKEVLKITKKRFYKGLNFILSDSKNFYVFRGVNPRLKDSFNYYCLNYLIKDNSVIVSSDPLTNEKWIPIKLGELLIIDEKLNIKKIKIY